MAADNTANHACNAAMQGRLDVVIHAQTGYHSSHCDRRLHWDKPTLVRGRGGDVHRGIAWKQWEFTTKRAGNVPQTKRLSQNQPATYWLGGLYGKDWVVVTLVGKCEKSV
jgi:hypothetical protein